MYKWFNWCIIDLRSVSARVNARGYPCAKGCNSSASQWLSGEQVRLCSGHPKVHFGTIVEGSWGGCTVGPPGSLTITSDFKTGSPVATLPGAWRYKVSAGNGQPGVSSLWLGQVESLICNIIIIIIIIVIIILIIIIIYLSVAARKIVWADPSLRHTSLLLGR